MPKAQCPSTNFNCPKDYSCTDARGGPLGALDEMPDGGDSTRIWSSRSALGSLPTGPTSTRLGSSQPMWTVIFLGCSVIYFWLFSSEN